MSIFSQVPVSVAVVSTVTLEDKFDINEIDWLAKNTIKGDEIIKIINARNNVKIRTGILFLLIKTTKEDTIAKGIGIKEIRDNP